MRLRMTFATTAAAALATAALVPATASADKTFRGKTQQGRTVTMTTGDDNVLKILRINWLTRRCALSGSRFQHITLFRPPFDSATPDAFNDAGSFRVADDGGIRSRVTIYLAGRRNVDPANPAVESWTGTLRANVVVRRRGRVIDRCRLRQITWNAAAA